MSEAALAIRVEQSAATRWNFMGEVNHELTHLLSIVRNGCGFGRRFELEKNVGEDDDCAADEEVECEAFIWVIDCGEAGDISRQEESEEAGEDGFDSVEEAGFGGGDVRLPAVHHHVSGHRAE